MVLATGSQLIEDVRRAPDDVLSRAEPLNEVRCTAKWSVHTHAHHLVHSSRIHTRLIEPERQIHARSNSFQINAGYCRHFPGGSRWARRSYGWLDPGSGAWYVANSYAKRVYHNVPLHNIQSGWRFPLKRLFNAWFAAQQIVFLSEFPYVRNHLLVPLSFQWHLIDFSSRPGSGLSKLDLKLRGQCLESSLNHYMVSEASQGVRGPFRPRFLSLNLALVSFLELYRTFLLKFKKKLNLSDLWLRSGLRRWKNTERTGMINRFVRPSYLVPLSSQFHGRSTEWYAYVAHERGQGCGEVRRRYSTAIARGQSCSHKFDVYGKWWDLVSSYNAILIAACQ